MDTPKATEPPTSDAARRRAVLALIGAAALLATIVLSAVLVGALLDDRGETGTGPSPLTSPRPDASTSASQPGPAAEARPLPGGTHATGVYQLPVHAEPGMGAPFATLGGQSFYVRGNRTSSDGSVWQEIQFPSADLGAWVFGWVPVAIDGHPALAPLEDQPCPTQDEFSAGFVPDPPRLVVCLELGGWSTQGFLIREAPQGPVAYTGEPAWLAQATAYYLTGAVGPAVTSWSLDLHFPPDVPVSDAWTTDREGFSGTRVWVYGHVRDQAARECRLEAADPRLADPTEMQSVGWCLQRFIVTDIRPGFAEPPATAGDHELTECLNEADGYMVRIPVDWFANEEGEIGSCRRFSPVSRPPSTEDGGLHAPVEISVFDGGIGYIERPDYVAFETLTMAGFRAVRFELGEDGSRTYTYHVNLGDGPEEVGPTLVASVAERATADYEATKRVLDVMLRGLQVTGD